MDIEQLIQKAKSEPLNEQEQKEVLNAINTGLNGLRESDPIKFLELVYLVNDSLKEINSTLRKI